MRTAMLNRRQLFKGLAAAAGASAAAGGMPRWARATAPDVRFLIVIPAFGGAQIIDSFLPIRQSESSEGATLDTFPDAQVVDIDGSPFRAADAVLDHIV